MRVHFPDAAVFDDPAVFDSLNRLLARADQGVHELSFGDVDGLLQSALWKVGLAPYKRVEWEEQRLNLAVGAEFEDRTREPGAPPKALHVLVVKARGGRPTPPVLRHVPVDEVGAWSETPLRLLLENKRDFKLLVGAARVYAGTPRGGMTWLELAEIDRALHVDGRGGCGEVWNTLKEVTDPADMLVRIFVAIDSDRVVPTGEKGTAQRNIVSWLERAGEADRNQEIQVRILEKREIENYIPRALLDARALTPAQKKVFRSWDKLTEDQKDHDDMKVRFNKEWIADCLSAMGESPPMFTASDLDARAGQELRELLSALKERL